MVAGSPARRFDAIATPMRAHAAELLAALDTETQLLVTDGVFSMDGDLAPLPELARAARNCEGLAHRR